MLYAGASREAGIDIFNSTDGGVTWNVASATNPDPGYVPLWGLGFELAIDPYTPGAFQVGRAILRAHIENQQPGVEPAELTRRVRVTAAQ